MDQGVAAVWAGIAGLTGAGIGGGFAAWGSWLGGKKAVEAAERAEQRAAAAEHQQWLREKRYEAYRAYLDVVHDVMTWERPEYAAAAATATQLRELLQGVVIVGPHEVLLPAAKAMQPLREALAEVQATSSDRIGQVPARTPVPWPLSRMQELGTAYSELSFAVSDILGEPPA